MRETGRSGYKRKFMDELEKRYPGCVLLHTDTRQLQGIPDLLMLWNDIWAAFEVKASADADRQPNQPWYVERWNEMSFAAFVYPEIEEQVLDELQQTLQSRWQARLP